MKNKFWQPTKVAGLRRYVPTGVYYLHKKFAGRVVDESLDTADLPSAKVRFSDRVSKLTRTPPAADPLTKSARLSFRDLVAIYIARLKSGAYGDLDSKTVEKREYLVRSLKSAWAGVPEFKKAEMADFEALSPSEVSYDDLLAWRKYFLALPEEHEDYDEGGEPGLGYSPDYFNKTLKVVRDLFGIAVERNQIIESPTSRIKPAPVQRESYTLPTPEQFAAILANNRVKLRNGQPVKPPRDGVEVEPYHNALSQHCRDLVEGISWTGLRLSEARALHRDFVDLEHWEIRLPASVCKGVKGKKLGRTIDILPEARPLFARLYADAGADGKLFKVSEATCWLKRACEAAGWRPALTHHSLRHYYATRCLEATQGDVLTVAGWLGHRDNGKLLLTTYAHLCRKHSKATAEKIRFNPDNVIHLSCSQNAAPQPEQPPLPDVSNG